MLFAPSTPVFFFFIYSSQSTLPYLALPYPAPPYLIISYPTLYESNGTAQHSRAPLSLTSLLYQHWKIFNFYFARSTWNWSCGLHCTVLHCTALNCTVLYCMAWQGIALINYEGSGMLLTRTLPSPMKWLKILLALIRPEHNALRLILHDLL